MILYVNFQKEKKNTIQCGPAMGARFEQQLRGC